MGLCNSLQILAFTNAGKNTQNKSSSENHESQSNCPKLYLIPYVDDIIIPGERKEVDNLIKHIRQSFNIKTANEIAKYAGYQVKEDEDSILLTQENYIKASAKRFRKTEIKQVNYPMSNPKIHGKIRISFKTSSIVGTLSYAALNTRPDVNYDTNLLARTVNFANPVLLSVAKEAIKYLYDTSKYGVRFKKSKSNKIQLRVQTDSDWASEHDNRRSISGNLNLFKNGPLLFSSKKQSMITL
eukprot:maker-scaffold_44-snap-gene-1.95-mRNA-1 protein AED:0.29 eAED:0.33 QI:0/0/0/1/0/0/2/0/240